MPGAHGCYGTSKADRHFERMLDDHLDEADEPERPATRAELEEAAYERFLARGGEGRW